MRSGGVYRPAAIKEPTKQRVRDFYQACEEGCLTEVKTYLLAGWPVDEMDATPGRPRRCALSSAAAHGRVRVVRLLILSGANPNRQDDLKRTALHHAAMSNHRPTLQCLLYESQADPHAPDAHQNTPLHLAAKQNCLEAVDELMSADETFTRQVCSLYDNT